MKTPMTAAEIAALNAAFDAEMSRREDESPHIVTADVASDAGLECIRHDDESGTLYRNAAGRYVYGWESGGFDDQVGE